MARSASARSAVRVASKLRVQPHRERRHRSAVAVVTGIDDELVVRGGPQRAEWKAVIGFHDLFVARMRELAVADQDAEAAGIEIGDMWCGKAVDDAG
jgi:hypothetical protein